MGIVTYNMVLSQLSKNKKYDEMKDIFNSLVSLSVPPDRVTFSIMIHAFGKNMDSNHQKYLKNQLIEKHGLESVDGHIYTHLVNGLIESGDTNSVIEMFTEIKDRNVDITTNLACSLIRALSKSKQYDLCWEGRRCVFL